MKYLIYLLIFISLLSVIKTKNAHERPEIHCKHFFYGYPSGTPKTNDLIIRDLYALSNNDDTKFADWVAYKLTMHEVDGDLTVERKWKTDPWLDESETLEPSPKNKDDYKNAHNVIEVDRGHQVPLGSFKGSRHASHTNYYSNITPQKTNLNQNSWKHLENKVRELVKYYGVLWVMTGTLYERDMEPLPKCDEPHKVPSGYWKIICLEMASEIKIAAFIFEQDTPKNSKILNHKVTIDEIEQRTGLDFFWELEDSKENRLERTIDNDFLTKFFSN